MSLPVSRRVSLSTGLRYHFLEWGGDDQQIDHTVVLVHGFLDLSWTWEAVVAAGLAGKYHVVAPDLRGHGDSDRVIPAATTTLWITSPTFEDFIAKVGRTCISRWTFRWADRRRRTLPASIHSAFQSSRCSKAWDRPTTTGQAGLIGSARGFPAWKRQSERGGSKRYATIEEAAARLRATDPKLGP